MPLLLRDRAATAWAPLRALPLVVAAVYMGALFGGPAAAPDWVIGMAAAAIAAAGGRLPLTVTLAQSAILVLIAQVVVAPVAANVVLPLAILAVAELWMRRRGVAAWAGAAALVAAQLVIAVPRFDPLLSTSAILLITIPPVLVGYYVRSVLQVAIEADRRHEQAVAEARTAERTAIARELHDLVAHHLSSIAVRTGAARFAAADGTVPVAVVGEVHETARSALEDLRRLLTSLRDPAGSGPGALLADPSGLSREISSAVAATRSAGVTVDAEVTGIAELDAARRLAVLRIVQEGLTNTREHAGPGASATLRVRSEEGSVEICLLDDGAGAPRAGTGHGRGLGLVGMRERVELLAGDLEVGPSGPGWRVRAVLPGTAS